MWFGNMGSTRRTSSDDTFEFIDTTDVLSVKLTGEASKHLFTGNQNNFIQMTEATSPTSKRTGPLTLEQFQGLRDSDGRLVDESSLRRAVFLGGIEPGARKEVWQYLFALYPCNSTKREREALLLDYIVKYEEMKSGWKEILKASAPPGVSDLEQGLVARYQLPDGSLHLSPDLTTAPLQYFNPDLVQHQPVGQEREPTLREVAKHCKFLDANSPETKQQISFMKIQAQVFVNRQKLDATEIRNCLRLIDKDVPRTDRDVHYFKDSTTPTLTMLREMLITYAAFQPTIGYAQGMNDIIARFLFVFDSEVEAYWCFHNYLEKIKTDFLEEGMVGKIVLVRKLLLEMDKPLLEHLEQHDLGDLIFCHRWLLLGFKREFSFLDSLRVFEILSSHHLELSSMEAETAKRRQLMKDFANTGGMARTAPVQADSEFTFELFMCVALLQHCRDQLLTCTDAAMVFDVINHLDIQLDNILEKSEQLFFKYCRKTVEDSFQIVDTPSKVRHQKR